MGSTLIIGATGTIGSELVKLLVEANQKVRVFARNPDKARGLFGSSVEVSIGDLLIPGSLEDAFIGVDKAFVLSQPIDDSFPQQEKNAFNAAKKAGVKHIVKVSAVNGIATYLLGKPFSNWHLESENHLRSLGIDWTILRPSFFASNFIGDFAILQHGGLFLPAADGKDAPIDPRDISAVAAKILVSPASHAGKIYELTGPELLSYSEAAGIIGKVYERDLTYTDIPPAAWKDQMLAGGAPIPVTETLLTYFSVGVKSNQIRITQTVREILGRPANSLEKWAVDDKLKQNKKEINET